MSIVGDAVIALIMLCAAAGAIAAIFNDREGLGKEFLEGLHAIGHIFIPVAGIMASIPFLSALVKAVLGPAFEAVGADPAIAGTSFIAVDMGGYQLAYALKGSPESWIMAMIVGYMAGATIVFSIPVGLALLDKRDHKYMALGVLSGVLSIPVGVFIASSIIAFTSPSVRAQPTTSDELVIEAEKPPESEPPLADVSFTMELADAEKPLAPLEIQLPSKDRVGVSALVAELQTALDDALQGSLVAGQENGRLTIAAQENSGLEYLMIKNAEELGFLQTQSTPVRLDLSFRTIGLNLIPLVSFVVLLALGLRFFPDVMIRGFMVFGRLMDAALKLVLVCSIIEYFTGFFTSVLGSWGFDPIIADDKDRFRALEVAGYIGIMLAGAFPMVYLVRKYLAKPVRKIGERVGLEGPGAAGILAAMANILAMFRLVRDMRPKDKVLNIAFAVCAAFLFGDHLSFTANFQPNLILAVLAGKLGGGVFAFILAYRLSVPKALELEREERPEELAGEPEAGATTSILAWRLREQPRGDDD